MRSYSICRSKFSLIYKGIIFGNRRWCWHFHFISTTFFIYITTWNEIIERLFECFLGIMKQWLPTIPACCTKCTRRMWIKTRSKRTYRVKIGTTRITRLGWTARVAEVSESPSRRASESIGVSTASRLTSTITLRRLNFE